MDPSGVGQDVKVGGSIPVVLLIVLTEKALSGAAQSAIGNASRAGALLQQHPGTTAVGIKGNSAQMVHQADQDRQNSIVERQEVTKLCFQKLLDSVSGKLELLSRGQTMEERVLSNKKMEEEEEQKKLLMKNVGSTTAQAVNLAAAPPLKKRRKKGDRSGPAASSSATDQELQIAARNRDVDQHQQAEISSSDDSADERNELEQRERSALASVLEAASSTTSGDHDHQTLKPISSNIAGQALQPSAPSRSGRPAEDVLNQDSHFLEKHDLPYYVPDLEKFPNLRTLQNYQKQGIAFLFARENPEICGNIGNKWKGMCENFGGEDGGKNPRKMNAVIFTREVPLQLDTASAAAQPSRGRPGGGAAPSAANSRDLSEFATRITSPKEDGRKRKRTSVGGAAAGTSSTSGSKKRTTTARSGEKTTATSALSKVLDGNKKQQTTSTQSKNIKQPEVVIDLISDSEEEAVADEPTAAVVPVTSSSNKVEALEEGFSAAAAAAVHGTTTGEEMVDHHPVLAALNTAGVDADGSQAKENQVEQVLEEAPLVHEDDVKDPKPEENAEEDVRLATSSSSSSTTTSKPVLNPLWSEYRIIKHQYNFTLNQYLKQNAPHAVIPDKSTTAVVAGGAAAVSAAVNVYHGASKLRVGTTSGNQSATRVEQGTTSATGTAAAGSTTVVSSSATTSQQNTTFDRLYFQPGTGELRVTFPDINETSCRGGILADEMGLGKTIQMLGLLATDFDQRLWQAKQRIGNKMQQHENDAATRMTNTLMQLSNSRPKLGPTLVVTPLSLMGQWIREMDRFLHNDSSSKPSTNTKGTTGTATTNKIRYLEYYGSDRKGQHFSNYDIVFTTYGVVNVEDVRTSPLFQQHSLPQHNLVVQQGAGGSNTTNNSTNALVASTTSTFRRIILDEAQCIKGKHTKLSKKIALLKADYKWCVSGTPMQNSVEELYPQLRFLELEPFCVQHVWRKLVSDPLFGRTSSANSSTSAVAAAESSWQSTGTVENQNSEQVKRVLELIKMICKPIVLRRTKETKSAQKVPVKNVAAGESKSSGAQAGNVKTHEIVYRNLITLPKRHEVVLYAELEYAERKVYDRLFQASKRKMDVLLQTHTEDANKGPNQPQQNKGSYFTSILALVLKLRMCLAHCSLALQEREWEPVLKYYLTHGEQGAAAETSKMSGAECSSEIELAMQDAPIEQQDDKEQLGNQISEVCASCGEMAEDPKVVQPCQHVYCAECLHLLVEEAKDSGLLAVKCVACKVEIVMPETSNQKTDDEHQMIQPNPTAATASNKFPKAAAKQRRTRNKTNNSTGAAPKQLSLLSMMQTSQNAANNAANKQAASSTVGSKNKAAGLVPTSTSSTGSYKATSKPAAPARKPTSSVLLQQHRKAIQYPSAKMKLLAEKIKHDVQIENRKILVFSQWTCFLSLLESYFLLPEGSKQLTSNQVRTLDGSLSIHQRQDCVDWLQAAPSYSASSSPPPGKVLLISLKAGGVGLNLVSATRAYLLDLWWNPAVEEQAFQRIHRIGQLEEVYCVKFVIKKSIDERILALQEKKRQLIQG
ncbi:unnamed protein product, partial [Amoebophrya sp. A120]